MKIALVHPAGFNFVPGQPDFSVLANRMAPIGILQLASWLEKHGHPTDVHDCLGPYAPAGIEANAEIALAGHPDLVGFSATTSGFMDAADMAAVIKARRPEVKIVFGNVHVSSIGAPILDHFPEIDYLVIGEGEGAMLDLADGKAPKDIANLVWRDGEKSVANARRDRIRDLDELPFPAWEKLAGFPHAYHLPLFAYERRYGATMITSRGCPYTCSFCDRTVFERLYKVNSAQYVYDHMKHLRDRFGVHHINFYDDLFTAQKKRVDELCDLLIEKPLGMQFNCAIRTGHTSDGMLARLKQAGALMVSMGIESADPAMMERHKAGVTLDAVKKTVEQIHAAGLRAKGLFIFGMPGETPETIKFTSDFVLSLDLDEMNMTKFSPLHGAPIWDECISGRTGDTIEDWRLMNCLNFVYKPDGFESREEMDALYNWHVKRFYDSKGYRRRFARRLWQHRWSLWHILKHLPETIAAARYFSANKEELEHAKREFRLHPRQPLGLRPALSPELQADAIAAMSPIKVSRRVRNDVAITASPQQAIADAEPVPGV
ncbi:MAG: B12-binding domain-containing radical SAM protein [Gammaproteobacteria bacterium]|nr:B12-binding domain-containing radical SAM protein [Gammaproteobacteria bacterium]MBU1416167.1 B12-binding domain-containing radical SAM protein [Gammaproteobacteria bacterium]